MARTCPGCSDAMVEVEDAQATLDICGRCGGIWFDAGELEQKHAHTPDDLYAVGESARDCPDCNLRLTLWHSELLELERCGRCDGTYLDSGELELLLDVKRAQPGGATSRCDICHQLFPQSEMVLGELTTACAACAERLDIEHDPQARRKRELERRRVDDPSDPLAFTGRKRYREIDLAANLVDLVFSFVRFR